jgi:RNA polymerase primary sigma factor
MASPAPRPILDDGLRELTRAPLLSVEQEARAALDIDAVRRRLEEERARCPDGDRLRALETDLDRAAGRLALHNTRLAVSIAKRYVNRGLPLGDLVQEALLGLLKAARRFELRRGTRFSTAATWWIRQSIVLALQDKGRLIRVPGRALEALRRARRARAALEQSLGRDPSVEEIAAESGLPSRKTATLIRLLDVPRSLDARVDDRSLGDGLKAAEAVDDLLPEDLRREIDALNERERRILVRRYGLDGRDPSTLEDIGRELRVTRERVRQLEKRGLDTLRESLRRRGYALRVPSP